MESTSLAEIPTGSAFHRGVKDHLVLDTRRSVPSLRSLDKVEAEVQQLRRLLLPDIESVGVKNSNLHFVDK